MARAKNTPNDPQRRERIIAATVDVLQEGGVSAVTARAVAQHAHVPVSSVSYHFASVRELLLQASRRVIAWRAEAFDRWSRHVTADNVVERLAELVHQQVTSGRALTVIAYELHILGLRDEQFAQLSASSIQNLREHLLAHCSASRAEHLAAAADGCQLQALFDPDVPTPEEIAAVLRP